MKLNFTSTDDDSFLMNIANLIGSKVENGLIKIPDELGKGSIRGCVISPNLRLMIRQYELKADLNFKISLTKREKEGVMIAFHNIFKIKDETSNSLTESSPNMALLPYVQVYSAEIDPDLFIPANTRMNSIIIGVNVEYLKELLYPNTDNMLLQAMVSTAQPCLFEEIISPKIQNVAQEIADVGIGAELSRFYFKIKAEEMIYLLFIELLKRQDNTVQSLNITDVTTLYQVKEKILSKIETPPNLSELAIFACMSASKLNRLFNQVFGNSIYQYYQIFRMKEAAYLLKEGKFSVSEVGYRLGFSNLSHFTKIFETHIGVKPKKFKMTVY